MRRRSAIPARCRVLGYGFVLTVCSAFFAASASAAPPNDYGRRGRTVISGFLGASRSNVRVPDDFGHASTWSTAGHLTLVHFWTDNLALGGTLEGGVRRTRAPRVQGANVDYTGVDLDLIGYVPLQRVLGIRFWLWGGANVSRFAYRDPGDGTPYDLGSKQRRSSMSLEAGFSPDLLVLLSPSFALAFGPTFTVVRTLRPDDALDFGLEVGPRTTYSFGPDASTGATFEDSRAFGARQRTVLQVYTELSGDDADASVSFARFVVDGLAVGAYARGGYYGSGSRDFTLGALGLMALWDVPLPFSLSILAAPRAGFVFQRVGFERDTPHGQAGHVELALPVYLALHLHERLVLGLGPELASDLRIGALSDDAPNGRYVRGGVASTIAASF